MLGPKLNDWHMKGHRYTPTPVEHHPFGYCQKYFSQVGLISRREAQASVRRGRSPISEQMSYAGRLGITHGVCLFFSSFDGSPSRLIG